MISPQRITRVAGYGMTQAADAYVYRPTSVEEIRSVFEEARASGRKVTLRGAGRSYGDGNIGAESLLIDITRMNRILAWDSASGIIDCESGVTIENLWRYCLEDGYWPPVVTGTMYPTLGGALGMNVHGKNNYCQGTIGEHVVDMDVAAGRGWHVVIWHSDGFFRRAHGATRHSQPLKGLRRGHFVDQMAVDIQKAGSIVGLMHDMVIPDFVIECTRSGHGLISLGFGKSKGGATGSRRSWGALWHPPTAP